MTICIMYEIINYVDVDKKIIEVKSTFNDFKSVFKKVNNDLDSIWNERIPYPYRIQINKIDSEKENITLKSGDKEVEVLKC